MSGALISRFTRPLGRSVACFVVCVRLASTCSFDFRSDSAAQSPLAALGVCGGVTQPPNTGDHSPLTPPPSE
uniref:Putative secreted protein n=1 Tax=Anopheles marajoara TaxID=58244 RepID=A0A2M4CDT7_9DIPT